MPDNTNPTPPDDDDDEQRPETDFIPFGALERRLDELGPYDTDRIDAGPWS